MWTVLQRFSNTKSKDILQKIEGVKNMSDDIFIYATLEVENGEILKKVLERMDENNLTANAEKCGSNQQSVTYLGHIFSEQRTCTFLEKVASFVNANDPKYASEVRSLLGKAEYVSRFIENFSIIIEPLCQLTHQNKRS